MNTKANSEANGVDSLLARINHLVEAADAYRHLGTTRVHETVASIANLPPLVRGNQAAARDEAELDDEELAILGV